MPWTLTEYNETLGPVDLGELWALVKDGQGLRLVARTHPEGWELGLCRDGDVLRRDVVRRKARLALLTTRWLANAEKAGWALLRSEVVDTNGDVPTGRRVRAQRAH